MSETLVLHLENDWPATPAAPWVLLDAAGTPVAEGNSTPRQWPQARRVHVMLGGPQASWLRLRLPHAPRRDEPRLLAYALEEQLVHDADAQHLTVSRRSPREDGVLLDVLVIARARLAALLAALEALGRLPSRVGLAIEALPSAESGAWQLAAGAGAGAACYLRYGDATATAHDRNTAIALLAHLLGRDAPPLPPRVLATGDDPLVSELAAALPPGSEIETDAPPPWWQDAARATNLLHDEFFPSHERRRWRRALKGPAVLAGTALAALWLVTLAGIVSQRAELADLRIRMARVLATTLPGTPAIAPAQQLARALDQLRAERGLLREDDFLGLLQRYAQQAPPSAPVALRYEHGRLELDFAGARIPTDELEALRATGLVARPGPGGSGVLELSPVPLR